MDDWAASIFSFWQRTNIKLEKGASKNEIAATEKVVGIRFPMAFVELYSLANGFTDSEMNEHMISIWPLSRIKDEYADSDDKNFVGFCDYLTSSHHIGFSKDTMYIFKDKDEFTPMASTFEEAIELVSTGSDMIY